MKAFTGAPTDSRFRNTLTAGVATENAENVAMCSEGDHRSDLFFAGCSDKGYILYRIRVKTSIYRMRIKRKNISNCAFYSNHTGLVSAQ